MRYRSSRKPPRSDISWIFFCPLSPLALESRQPRQLCTGLGRRLNDGWTSAAMCRCVFYGRHDEFLNDVTEQSTRFVEIDAFARA